MKKKSLLILALVAVALIFAVGCNGDLNSSRLNPPRWIQGEWASIQNIMVWTFTSDNAVMTTSSGSGGVNFGEMPSSVKYTESSTDTSYKIVMNDGTSSSTYNFTKTTDDTISFSMSLNGLSIPGATSLTKR